MGLRDIALAFGIQHRQVGKVRIVQRQQRLAPLGPVGGQIAAARSVLPKVGPRPDFGPRRRQGLLFAWPSSVRVFFLSRIPGEPDR